MTIQQALDFGAKLLLALERPRLESEILLAFVLNKPRIYLHTHYLEIVNPHSMEFFKRLLERRKNFEPLEYLIEKVSFYGKEFYISKGTLIPRPETEILIDIAINLIQTKNCKNIAEIGIGSGIISITLSLLSKNQDLNFYASDISPEALFNAFVNLKKFNCNNIHLYRSEYLDFDQDLKFDLLVANPPYIKEGTNLPKPLSFEPHKALFGGLRGDEILCHIITLSKQRGISYVICEMGHDQRSSIESFVNGFTSIKRLEFYQDLAGLDRGFILEF